MRTFFHPISHKHHVKSESFPHDAAKIQKQTTASSKSKPGLHQGEHAPRQQQHEPDQKQNVTNVKAEQRTTTSRQYGESDQNPTTSVKTRDDLKTKQNTIKKLQSLIEYDL